MIRVKRVYEPVEDGDGRRVLVDRLWPRGVAKARVGEWRKELAPSNELRTWIHQQPERWEEFQAKYWEELRQRPEAIAFARELMETAQDETVTLLYAAKDNQRNHALVLATLLAPLADHE